MKVGFWVSNIQCRHSINLCLSVVSNEMTMSAKASIFSDDVWNLVRPAMNRTVIAMLGLVKESFTKTLCSDVGRDETYHAVRNSWRVLCIKLYEALEELVENTCGTF